MSSTLRVAHVAMAELQLAGAPTFHTLEIANGLTDLGAEVTLFTPPGSACAPVQCSRVEVPFHGYSGLRAALFWRAASRRLERHGRRAGLDLIYARYHPGCGRIGRVAQRLGIPFVVEINGSVAQLLAAGVDPRTVESVDRRVAKDLRPVDHAIVQGSGIAATIASRYRLPTGRIHVVDNGVDPTRFRPLDRPGLRAELGLPEGPLLGYVGSYQPYHDLEVVVRALTLLEDTDSRLVLVGSGDGHARIRDLASSLGVQERLIFRDTVPQSTVAEFVNAFDICVMTVPGNLIEEARGFKLREYLACGRPVIASAGSERGDPLLEYTWEVAPDEPAAVAQAVHDILSNRGAALARARIASDIVRAEYSWAAASRKTLSILDAASRQRAARGVWGPRSKELSCP